MEFTLGIHSDEKIKVFFKKGIDKRNPMWYTIQAARDEAVSGTKSTVFQATCRNGGIGRRPGLKIPYNESYVPVQARFPASSLC